MKNLKELYNELNKPFESKKEELIAFEDENEIVHITTKTGVPKYIMPKDVYIELLKYTF